MAEPPENKSVTLTSSWKQYFIAYLLSVLAMPLFGIGIIALYFVRKKQLSKRYEVTDTHISIDSKYRRNVDLVDIREVAVRQNWLQEKLNVGTVVLKTSAATIELVGMERPVSLKQMIQTAASAQKNRGGKQSFRERPDPTHKPGSMDKMDYLTGLWQQGLLSDEDYKQEKKHFE